MKLQPLWAEAYAKPLFVLLATIAILIWASGALAYEDYAAGCDNCHGGFTDSPYISLSDGSNWGDSLHNIHRNDMLNSDCDVCHTGSSRTPVLLESSNGGTGLAAISCVGCHGRDEDNGNATLNGTSQRGAGLRQHHAGQATCTGCHDDQTGYTPVGENILPNYYANPGTGHPAMPTNSCNPSGGENFAGTALGLDNDGDDIYDTADSNCVVAADTATLTLAKTVVNDDGGTAIDTDFTLTATGPDTISGIEGAPAITSATVAIGAYALTESSLAGYTLQGWVCTSGLSGSTVTLTKDQVVTCTATNTDNPVVVAPALTMTKSASPSIFDIVGELIDYSYVVRSTGTLPVTGPITVSDSLMTVTCPPVSSVGNGDGDLDPGESLVCTSSYVVQQADLDAGFITSSSTASGGNASTGIIPITVSYSLLLAIPTLSEWTMILLSFLFLLMGFGYLRRRVTI